MAERGKVITTVSALATLTAFAVGGFISEPAPPKPKAGEDAIATWSGTPFVPSSIDKIIDTVVAPEDRDDMTMSLKLYNDKTVGNYAVMGYKTPGEKELTGTLTCLPAPVEEEPNASEGFKIYLDTDHTEFLGQVPKAQTFNFTGAFAKDVCVRGLTEEDLPKFKHPV